MISLTHETGEKGDASKSNSWGLMSICSVACWLCEAARVPVVLPHRQQLSLASGADAGAAGGSGLRDANKLH